MENYSSTGNKKFYKIDSLRKCFVLSKEMINKKIEDCYSGQLISISDLSKNGIYNVDEDTIFFITASLNDYNKFVKISFTNIGTSKGSRYIKIKNGDTLIWVKGDFYAISKNSITDITSDNDNLIITYSDGTNNKINLLEITSDYNGIYPISIDNDLNISLTDIFLDKNNKNYIRFSEHNHNSIKDGVTGASVIGVGNTGSSDNQFVLGQYSKSLDDAMLVVGGGTENNRKNIFVVSKDGNTYFEKDAIAGKNQEYKLSEIHSVKPSDWAFINTTASTVETLEFSDFE